MNIQPKIDVNNYTNNNISSARYRRVFVQSQNNKYSKYNYNGNNVQTQPNNYAQSINSERTKNYNGTKTEGNFQEGTQSSRFNEYPKNVRVSNGNY